jgi:hypothetical protein
MLTRTRPLVVLCQRSFNLNHVDRVKLIEQSDYLFVGRKEVSLIEERRKQGDLLRTVDVHMHVSVNQGFWTQVLSFTIVKLSSHYDNWLAGSHMPSYRSSL